MQATPAAITKVAFDTIMTPLVSELRQWWDDETQTLDAAQPPSGYSPLTAGLPELDSKCAIKASPIIRKWLGMKLKPSHIRRGGYHSFEDFINHLLPQLRNLCPDEPSTQAAAGGRRLH